MREKIKEVFLSVRSGQSPDIFVADPDLNLIFIDACRASGLTESPFILNKQLLNLRKAGDLRELKSSRKIIRDQDEFRFASEMAARFLERKYNTTLDEIICDPEKVCEFDELAKKIAPGFTSFQYRWAALGL
jgi:hypothetical protein